jgi:hypothetical protein
MHGIPNFAQHDDVMVSSGSHDATLGHSSKQRKGYTRTDCSPVQTYKLSLSGPKPLT